MDCDGIGKEYTIPSCEVWEIIMIHDFFLVFLLNHVLLDNKVGFPLANIFAQSDFFPLSLSFRLKPSGTNNVETKEKSRFARKYSLVENRLNLSRAFSSPCLWSYLLDVNSSFEYIFKRMVSVVHR